MDTNTLSPAKIVSREEWLAARKALLAKEREMTHALDALRAERRRLPWVKVEKPYVFEGPRGKSTLADLFRGKSQLAIYHFMLTPGSDHICPGCSFIADHVDAARQHFEQADLAFAAIARAPLARIEEVRHRMGWTFPWLSSHGSDFNYDFGVSFSPAEVARGKLNYNYGTWPHAGEEWPGVSVFYKDDAGDVFHTYSTYGRGVEVMMGTYRLLDLTPKGRDEEGLQYTMAWVRHHDRYEPAPTKGAPAAGACCSARA
jgi:predicted dithiol-disulfide oxidoreductase (DUF899 family)